MTEWYAVHTAPRAEPLADTNLRRQGYHTWFPFERVRRRKKLPNRTAYKVEWISLPYFPRYLFVAMRGRRHESIGSINRTHGVMTVVTQAGEPLPIPNEVMTELMARSDVKGCIGQVDETKRPGFPQGVRVEFVEESPLAGLIACVSLDAGSNVRVFLDILGKQREITVSPNHIVAV